MLQLHQAVYRFLFGTCLKNTRAQVSTMPTFAAVDVGSNSVRLKIAKLVRGKLETVHEDREVTRLGESVFRGGLLEPKAITQTVRVLSRFHRAATSAGADRVRIVATSAVRDARNASSFLEWVRSETGWNPEIISGIEEGRLIHLGVLSNMRISTWPLLLIDLGGGSCELTVSDHGQIRSMVSLPLGAVRLTEEFLQNDPPKKKELERMGQFIAEETGRWEQRIKRRGMSQVIATSGTAAALAALAEHLTRTSSRKKDYVSRAAMGTIVREISKQSLAQRQAMEGIGPRRAEIIIAGAHVYAELVERFSLPGFAYSPLGLRDGMLSQMLAEHDRNTAAGRRIETERQAGLLETARHYGADMRYAEHIRDLTLSLFKQLKAVHRLPPEYEEWLSAAAIMQEVGSFVNRSGRHRHAYYIIANSEIYGFTTEQRRLIAAIARYVGKSRPSPQDRALRLLPPQDRQFVPRAIVLLRLARALNQGRKGAVTNVTTKMKDSGVHFRVETKRGGAELEAWSLTKEKNYFREVFGRELVLADS
jgi:exopolyphosphatase/guanosine-5'-triphosphate,3'-diphosphate pyrophosphatase